MLFLTLIPGRKSINHHMSRKINPLAINISFNKLEFCNAHSENPISFVFPDNVVSEMEVLDHTEFKSKLQSFFSENKIHAEPVVLILGESMYYSKDFLTSTPPLQEDIQKYLDLVPFSSVSFRVYKLPIGHRLVVINRDFYESFKNILLTLGFSIVSVVPSFVITGPGTTSAFSAQTCLLINRKMDVIMDNSFGGQEISPNATANSRQFIRGHKTVVAIITILIILACPLILYFYYQNQQTVLKASKTRTAAVTTVRKRTVTPTPTVSPLAALKLEQYTLQLLNGSGTPGLVASLEAKFKAVGFAQITTGNFPQTNQTTVIFKPTIGKEIRALIQTTLSPQFKNISIKESTSTQFDINITTGKITP